MSAPKTPVTDVASALRATRARVVSKGWKQHTRKCLFDHLGEAVPDAVWMTVGLEAYRHLQTTIGCKSVVAWNDEPGRTVEQVLEVLDQAIATAEKPAAAAPAP